MRKIFVVLSILLTFIIMGCSSTPKVDENTQKFADLYNSVVLQSAIYGKNIDELKVLMKDKKRRNIYVIEYRQARNDKAACEAMLVELKKKSFFKKAEEAGILLKEDIKSKSKKDLLEDYNDISKKLGGNAGKKKLKKELDNLDTPNTDISKKPINEDKNKSNIVSRKTIYPEVSTSSAVIGKNFNEYLNQTGYIANPADARFMNRIFELDTKIGAEYYSLNNDTYIGVKDGLIVQLAFETPRVKEVRPIINNQAFYNVKPYIFRGGPNGLQVLIWKMSNAYLVIKSYASTIKGYENNNPVWVTVTSNKEYSYYTK